jgi:hypothetical protein
MEKIPEGSGTISAKVEATADGKFYPSGSGTVIVFAECN